MRGPGIHLKDATEQAAMRAAGRAAASVLEMIEPHVRAGVTTGQLDDLCREYVLGPLGCRSATIGYTAGGTRPPFPGAICTSVNEVVCHGIPDGTALADGDIVNVDVTVIKDGFHGDTSRMFYVGEPAPRARRLVEAAREAMLRGIRAVRPGATLGCIGHAVESHASSLGYSVVREYCGHGIGRGFHEDPQVLHYGRPRTGVVLEPGMTFTVEPMLNAGAAGTRELRDGWTVVTRDRSLSAQWEHTVLVTADGVEVLTLRDGEA
jgi:methionyl aminopeptidase